MKVGQDSENFLGSWLLVVDLTKGDLLSLRDCGILGVACHEVMEVRSSPVALLP